MFDLCLGEDWREEVEILKKPKGWVLAFVRADLVTQTGFTFTDGITEIIIRWSKSSADDMVSWVLLIVSPEGEIAHKWDKVKWNDEFPTRIQDVLVSTLKELEWESHQVAEWTKDGK